MPVKRGRWSGAGRPVGGFWGGSQGWSRSHGSGVKSPRFIPHHISRRTNAASVPQQVFGRTLLPCCLIVHCYDGYRKAPCTMKYCCSYLLRKVQDLEKEFPDAAEVTIFMGAVAP
jgi:hypothetical protein